MSTFDMLIVLSGPATAPSHGEKNIEVRRRQFPFGIFLSRLPLPFNIIGFSASTLPNGVNERRMLTGVQIVGPPDSEMLYWLWGISWSGLYDW